MEKGHILCNERSGEHWIYLDTRGTRRKRRQVKQTIKGSQAQKEVRIVWLSKPVKMVYFTTR